MKPIQPDMDSASSSNDFVPVERQQEALREWVVEVPLTELVPFRNHPFQVQDDERMKETSESVREFGVLVPGIVRPLAGGGYELVAGHRRKRACELAGLDKMPVIIRDLDDDEAVLLMVDSNLQRENILPSERAKAYSMKLEALKRRAERGRPARNNSRQVGENSIAKVASDVGESERQVQRYIRLNNLSPELLEMVDAGRLAITPAVEVSFLSAEEQQSLVTALETTQATPSLSQAQRMKKLSQEGKADSESFTAILYEEKKPLNASITLSHDTLSKYFPRSYTTRQMEQTIIRLLERWRQHRQKRQKEESR